MHYHRTNVVNLNQVIHPKPNKILHIQINNPTIRSHLKLRLKTLIIPIYLQAKEAVLQYRTEDIPGETRLQEGQPVLKKRKISANKKNTK